MNIDKSIELSDENTEAEVEIPTAAEFSEAFRRGFTEDDEVEEEIDLEFLKDIEDDEFDEDIEEEPQRWRDHHWESRVRKMKNRSSDWDGPDSFGDDDWSWKP